MEIKKTKFGYFVCNKTTYLRIKKLRGYYHIACQQVANWKRWHNKLPENRIIKIRRYENGRTMVSLVLPRPEPPLMPVFCRKESVQSYYDSNGKYIPGGSFIDKISLCDMGILVLWEQVKRPKKYAKNLPEISITDAEIANMLSEIEKSKSVWEKAK